MIADAHHECPQPAAAGIVLLCDPDIYTDLLTGDYVTGTSTTNSIQSEPPEPPTSLTATALPQEIEFKWTLGAFWTLNGITELWEHTANTPFSSATKIWEGRGNRTVIGKTDTTTRYYWVRMRTIAGQVSDELGATLNGNGLAAAARRSETGDIDDNAATEIYTDSDIGPTTITPLFGDVCRVTVPAISTTYVAIVTATGDFWKNNASFRHVFLLFTSVGGVSGTAGNLTPFRSTASPGDRLSLRHEFTVSDGAAHDFVLISESGTIGSQSTHENVRLQVEVIKR
jgi:hypothetical protein